MGDLFKVYDACASTGSIPFAQVTAFLTDAGTVPFPMKPSLKGTIERCVSALGQSQNDFPQMLSIVGSARTQMLFHTREQWRDLYIKISRPDSTVQMPEINKLLEKFNMLPKSSEQQQWMKFCFERLDADGTGSLVFDQFLEFVHHMIERLNFSDREHERKSIKALGVPDTIVAKLRKSFLQISAHDTGRVYASTVVSFFRDIQTALDLDEVNENRIKEHSKHLLRGGGPLSFSFVEFAGICQDAINMEQ